MLNVSKKWLLVVPLLILPMLLTGCQVDSSTPVSEQQQVADTHAKQVTAVPLPELTNSLERINIKKRLETFDNPNKVSYIYLVSYGKVMSFYTIKGKITSGNKRLTSSQQVIDCDTGEYTGSCITEAPELDGSYGSSAPYIFFWTTDGTYIQWSGDYMMADQPLKLSTPPELTREVK